MSMETVLNEVGAERVHQDDKWGGPEHDDAHETTDFLDFIWRRTQLRLMQLTDSVFLRRIFIEIAALAVAAVESIDRKAAAETVEREQQRDPG